MIDRPHRGMRRSQRLGPGQNPLPQDLSQFSDQLSARLYPCVVACILRNVLKCLRTEVFPTSALEGDIEKSSRFPCEPDRGREIALRCPRPRSSGRKERPTRWNVPGLAPLNAARTAQRAIPTSSAKLDKVELRDDMKIANKRDTNQRSSIEESKSRFLGYSREFAFIGG